MTYVLVCLINDELHDFHEKLVENVCSNFKVRRQKLQSHITIKAPFEGDNITEIENTIENFCRNHHPSDFEIDNYGHFGDRVIYMKVMPSKAMVETCDNFIISLKKIPWLEWKSNEYGKRIFHCTVVSKLPIGKYEPILEYILGFPCNFHCTFDNITIMKWDKDRWSIHKSYTITEKIP